MSERKAIRWWPAVVVGVIYLGVLGWTQFFGGLTGQDRFLQSMFATVLAVLLLLLWLLLLSRAPWKTRLLGLAGAVGVALAASQMFSIQGVTGDLIPILQWRWAAGEGGGPSPVESAGSPGSLAALDYPQFLGVGRDGKVAGVSLERNWNGQPPREIWRRPVGEGWSAFAVVGGRAVTQEQADAQERVVAYDLASGEILWTHADPARYATTIGGIGPRATPTISEGRVFTMGATGLLNALDLVSGERLWSRDVLAETGGVIPEWGKSASPLVIGDLVVVSAGAPAGGSLVAYEQETGEPVWRGGSDRSGYSSPQLVRLGGREQIVIFNQATVAAHDPGSGEVLWDFPWPNTQPNVAQPLPLPGDRLLVSSGYGIGSKMLRVAPGDSGGLEPQLIWESPRLKAKFTNLVLHEGSVYGLDDGTLVSLDPDTGERRWKRGRYGHGQLILVGDLLLILSEKGEVALVEANPEEYVEVAKFEALKGKSWNNPAFAAPYLLLRNDREAVCYELPVES